MCVFCWNQPELRYKGQKYHAAAELTRMYTCNSRQLGALEGSRKVEHSARGSHTTIHLFTHSILQPKYEYAGTQYTAFICYVEYPWLISCRRKGAATEGLTSGCTSTEARAVVTRLLFVSRAKLREHSRRTRAEGATLPAVDVDRPRG